jgi:putative aldouronate transport system permease protein
MATIKIGKMRRRGVGDIIFDLIIMITLALLVIVTVYPFWNTIAVSLNDGLDSVKGGIKLLPRKFTWQNYKVLFVDDRLVKAFTISVSRTVLQTILSVFCTSMLAYALSRKEFVIRKPLTAILVISMYVNAGLIPGYMLIKKLGMLNSYAVYIVPCLVDVFNFILIRTYINGLPDSFVESARIDGAGEFTIFLRIIMPLIVPSIAMVSLFVAVGAWNSWFDTYLYNGSKKDLYTLQYLLKMKLATTQNSSNAANTTADALATAAKVAPITIRCAITVVSAVPILVVYPFLQKYFVTGMALGSVKG